MWTFWGYPPTSLEKAVLAAFVVWVVAVAMWIVVAFSQLGVI